MGHRRRIELQREDLIRAYNEGASFATLGAKHGVSRVTIARRLHEWGANIRPPPWKADNGEDNGSDLRSQILELEEKIVVEERNLKLAHDRKWEYEQELAKLKGVSMSLKVG